MTTVNNPDQPLGAITVPVDPDGRIRRPFAPAIFLLRSRLNGTEVAVCQKIDELQEKEGITRLNATWRVMQGCREFGYINADQENDWWDKNAQNITLDDPALNLKPNKRSKLTKEARQTREAFGKVEQIIVDLPPNADEEEELRWVTTHPANLRRQAEKNSKVSIVITEEDITSSSAGPCPSRFAATLLIRFVNDPASLNRLIISTMQKKQKSKSSGGTAGGSSEFDHMDDLTDLYKYHEGVVRLVQKESAKHRS